MSVRPKSDRVYEGTQMQQAKSEIARRQQQEQRKQADIASCLDTADNNWVTVTCEPGKEGYFRYRVGYLLQAMRDEGCWYVWERTDTTFRFILMEAWGELTLQSVPETGLFELPQPAPIGDEKKDASARRLWQVKCKSVLQAAHTSGKRFWWNGSKDTSPWYEIGVLRITRQLKAAA